MHNLRCPFIVPFIASEKGFMHAYVVGIIGKTIYDAEQRLTHSSRSLLNPPGEKKGITGFSQQ